MTTEDFQRAYRTLALRQPFRPFRIEFASGDQLLIKHPEAIARFQNLFVFRAPNREQRVFDSTGVTQFIDPGQ